MRAVVLLALLAVVAVSCGRSHFDGTNTQFLQSQLAALDKLAPPSGVNPQTWSQLKGALHAQIEQQLRAGKSSSSVPSSNASKAHLAFDGTNQLSWGFNSAGDYDQNGEVNISDLTPLAVHFNQSVPADPNSIEGAVDGDGNGLINIADVTPIGANFGNRLAAYNVYVSQSASDYPASNSAASTVTSIGTVQLADATGNGAQVRKQFAFTLPAPAAGDIYWVRPSDGNTEGTSSTMAGPGAPIKSHLDLYQLSFNFDNGDQYPNTGWGEAALTFTGVDSLLYFSMTFNGTDVLENIPVVSTRGSGAEQTLSIPFPLGVANGTLVTEGTVSYTLDTAPKSTSARHSSGNAQNLQVAPLIDWNRPGNSTENWITPPVAAPLKWGPQGSPVVRTAKHKYPVKPFGANFDNTEQAAWAVGASLNYLREHLDAAVGDAAHPLNMLVTNEATGTTDYGAPVEWPRIKDAYMNAFGYPVETTVTRNANEAFDALQQDYDVELVIAYNQFDFSLDAPTPQITREVTSMTQLQNGEWLVSAMNCQHPEWDQAFHLAVKQQTGFNTSETAAYYWSGTTGPALCAWVIEKPKPAQTGWHVKQEYDWSGVNQSAVQLASGYTCTVAYDVLNQQVYSGKVEPDFGLQAQGAVAESVSPFGPEPRAALVDGELAALYVDDAVGMTTLYYNRMDATGSWGPHVAIDSGATEFFDGLALIDTPSGPMAAYSSNEGIKIAVGNDAAGTSFGSPFTIVGSFGNDVKLVPAPAPGPGVLMMWNDSGIIRVIPDPDATGGTVTATPFLDVSKYDAKWVGNKFIITTTTSVSGIDFTYSLDMTGILWNMPQVHLDDATDVKAVSLDALAPYNEVGLAALLQKDSMKAALKYFGSTDAGHTWTTTEEVTEIQNNGFKSDLKLQFNLKTSRPEIYAPDTGFIHLDLYSKF